MLAAAVPAVSAAGSAGLGQAPALELGSGAGFLQQHIDRLITSEIFRCPDITMVLDACALPFEDRSLRAIVMTDVLHHIPRCATSSRRRAAA